MAEPSYEELKNRLGRPHGQQTATSARSSSIPRWIWQTLLVAGSLAVLWFYFAPSRVQYAKNKREEAERTAQKAAQKAAMEAGVSELAKRYAPITDWRSRLGDRKITDPIYSAEIAPIFVNSEGKPVLFFGSVRNVNQIGGKYLVSVEARINLQTDLLLHLSCSEEQAKRIMSEPREEGSRFAIVATIYSVDSTEEQTRRDEAGGSSRHAVASGTGQLVDWQFVGRYYGDLQEILSTFKKP